MITGKAHDAPVSSLIEFVMHSTQLRISQGQRVEICASLMLADDVQLDFYIPRDALLSAYHRKAC
jgi:hypothetical protein